MQGFFNNNHRKEQEREGQEKMRISKMVLADAICGADMPEASFAEKMIEKGYAFAPDIGEAILFQWDKKVLRNLEDHELIDIYNAIYQQEEIIWIEDNFAYNNNLSKDDKFIAVIQNKDKTSFYIHAPINLSLAVIKKIDELYPKAIEVYLRYKNTQQQENSKLIVFSNKGRIIP